MADDVSKNDDQEHQSRVVAGEGGTRGSGRGALLVDCASMRAREDDGSGGCDMPGVRAYGTRDENRDIGGQCPALQEPRCISIRGRSAILTYGRAVYLAGAICENAGLSITPTLCIGAIWARFFS